MLDRTFTMVVSLLAFGAFLVSVSFGQRCSTDEVMYGRVEVESRFLKNELSGFYEYQDPNGGPLKKFASETWQGSYRVSVHYPEGVTHWRYSRPWVLNGSHVFSKSDWSEANGKTATSIPLGLCSFQSMGWDDPIYNTEVTSNLTFAPWAGPNFSWTHPETGSQGELLSVNARDMYAFPKQNVDCPGDWTGFGKMYPELENVYCWLSDEFTESDAEARALATAVWEEASMPALSYANDFSGTWKAPNSAQRMDPVLFHAQDIRFKVTFPALGCGDVYEITQHFKKWEQGSQKPEHSNFEESVLHKFDEAPFTYPAGGWTEVPLPDKGWNLELVGVSARRLCDDLPVGGNKIGLGSVDASFSLGKDVGGDPVGSIVLKAGSIDDNLYSASSLSFSLRANGPVEILEDQQGNLAQVKAPEALVLVTDSGSESVQMDFHPVSQITGADPETGLYSYSGSPYATYVVDNPDSPGTADRLRIVETNNGYSRTSIYEQDSNSGEWTFSKGNGERIERLSESRSGSDYIEDRIVEDSLGEVHSALRLVYRYSDVGYRLTQEIVGPGVLNRLTSYSYYTDPADTENYGWLKRVTHPDGSWEEYTYSGGRIAAIKTPFLNSTAGSADSSNRVISYTYGTIPDEDGDSEDEGLITTVTKVLGQETARSYEVQYTALETFKGRATEKRKYEEASSPGASLGAVGNQVSVTRRVKDGSVFEDRPASRLGPDGLLTTYLYSQSSTELETTVESGVPDVDGETILEGTRSTTTTDLFGNFRSQDRYDIATSLLLSSSVATQFDERGRETRIDYWDGTYELREYTCCGLASTRSRDGVATYFQYDDLGNVERIETGSKVFLIENDPLGRELSRDQQATNGTTITLSATSYDLVGRVSSSTNPFGGTTQYEYEGFDGTERIEREILPDGGVTEKAFARDGSLLSVSGSASRALQYEYGVDAYGQFTKEIRMGDNGETTEWSKSYSDFLGRPYRTEYANGGVEWSYYDASGRLERSVDADGVTQLYAYDELGRLEFSAIDKNDNDAIDIASEDQVMRFEREYASGAGKSVARTTNSVWTTDGDGTATETLSVEESSVDGQDRWVTVAGLETHVNQTFDGQGGRTITTTDPDGSQFQQTFSYDKLLSEQWSEPTLGVLELKTYSYDAFDRLESVVDKNGVATSFTYYGNGLLESVTTDDPNLTASGVGLDAQTISYTYDSSGRQIQAALPDGSVVHNEWHPSGTLKKSWGGDQYPVEYDYDQQLRLSSLTTWKDFAGELGAATTAWEYAPDTGLLARKVYPDATAIEYAYSLAGRASSRKWARQSEGSPLTTSYVYDSSGRLGSVDYSDSTADVQYSYDRRGRISSVTDAAGTLEYAYHANGQVASETYTSGLLAGKSVARSYDALNRAFSVTAAAHSYSYGYDEASRLDSVSSGDLNASYAFAAGTQLVDSVTVSRSGQGQVTTQRGYDRLYRLTSIDATPSSASARSYAYLYDDSNRRIEATLPDGNFWSYSYDALGQLSSAEKLDEASVTIPGFNFEFAYDDIGNRESLVANGRATNYIANDGNQYASRSVLNVVQVAGEARDTANMLLNGQPTQRSGGYYFGEVTVDNSASAVLAAVDVLAVENDFGPSGEDLIGEESRSVFVPQDPETYSYDADGNRVSDARWSYEWNGENRLVAMETSSDAVVAGLAAQRLEFVYDSQGRRIQKKAYAWDEQTSAFALQTTALFLYDGWNLIFEEARDAQGAVVSERSYVWGRDLVGGPQSVGGVGGLLFDIDPMSGAVHSPAFDGNGNIVAYADLGTGIWAREREYGPFGETLSTDGEGAFRFGFSSKYVDSESGLLYYGYRYYDVERGRWLNRDPIGERGGINLYGMVGNDPVNFVDVLGLSPCCPDGKQFSCNDLKQRLDLLNRMFNYASNALRNDLDFQFDSELTLFGIDRAVDTSAALVGASVANVFNSLRAAQGAAKASQSLSGQLHQNGQLARATSPSLGVPTLTAKAVDFGIKSGPGLLTGVATRETIRRPPRFGTNRLRDEIQGNVDNADAFVQRLADQLSELRRTYRECCL